MNDDKFDEFLDNATHKVADMWADDYRQNTLSIEEMYEINDFLTQFFSSKRLPEKVEKTEKKM